MAQERGDEKPPRNIDRHRVGPREDDDPLPGVQPEQILQHAKFLRAFSTTMTMLRAIAEKELAQRELDPAETKFLRDVIETEHSIGSGGAVSYAGWYTKLFYLGGDDSRKWDVLVADVHTDPPCEQHNDPGCILHQGVGGADLLMIAVDNGKDRMVYAGPVLSHYEFEAPGVVRKSDSEFQVDLQKGPVPPRPEWTRSYLVPRPSPAAKR